MPTIEDNHTIDGTGIGIYSSNMIELVPGTVYYVRAYATNIAGTSYGDEILFSTLTLTEALETIIAQITELEINSGIANSLITKLEKIIQSIESNRTTVAINQLNSLINELKAQKGKSIVEKLCDDLISKIQLIMDSISNLSMFTKSQEAELNSNSVLPLKYGLEQNYPNPFNPTTRIKFDLPKSSHVLLRVFDLLGEEKTTLVNKELSCGYHEIEFDAGNLPSGIYFYKLEAEGFIQTKKMILVR
jgi:hypothetical protein